VGSLKGLPCDRKPVPATIELCAFDRRQPGPQYFRGQEKVRKVVAEETGLEALNYLKGYNKHQLHQLHLILLDINMPGMNNWEAVTEVGQEQYLMDIQGLSRPMVMVPMKACIAHIMLVYCMTHARRKFVDALACDKGKANV